MSWKLMLASISFCTGIFFVSSAIFPEQDGRRWALYFGIWLMWVAWDVLKRLKEKA